jgi:hypothetical protein
MRSTIYFQNVAPAAFCGMPARPLLPNSQPAVFCGMSGRQVLTISKPAVSCGMPARPLIYITPLYAVSALVSISPLLSFGARNRNTPLPVGEGQGVRSSTNTCGILRYAWTVASSKYKYLGQTAVWLDGCHTPLLVGERPRVRFTLNTWGKLRHAWAIARLLHARSTLHPLGALVSHSPLPVRDVPGVRSVLVSPRLRSSHNTCGILQHARSSANRTHGGA